MEYVPFKNYPDLLTVDNIQSALNVGRNTALQIENYTVKIKRNFDPAKRLDDILYSFASARLKENSYAAV